MERRSVQMPDFVPSFFIYLIICAGVTYLVRMLPLVLVRGRIKNRFIRSFLYYIPYAVLSVMTFPAIFYSTGSVVSAAVGTVVALALAFFEKSLIVVAASSALAVLVSELIISAL